MNSSSSSSSSSSGSSSSTSSSSSGSSSSSSDQQENQSLRALLSHLTNTREQISALHRPPSSYDHATSFEAVELMLEPQESAKFSVALAFTLSTLYYILLNSKGKSTNDDGEKHPINAEISRIRQYVARMNQQQTNNKSSDNDVQTRSNNIVIEVAAVDEPTLQVNKEAVARIIKRNISQTQTQKHGKRQKKGK